MKRTPMKRSAPLRNSTQTTIRVKPKTCAKSKGGCGAKFVPARPMQCACSPLCAQAFAALASAKKAAKAAADDKRKTKARLDELKPISHIEEECRKIVQKIARVRDRNDGCISCHMGPNYDGQWHGSHYRAHGGCSSLQFHLWNIHKSCAQCNLFKGGNKDGYIRGLLDKPGYGRERIEWLDAQPKSKRFSREYLYRFKEVMGKRLRRMRKSER